jgi:peptide/nickel transport system permease protein
MSVPADTLSPVVAVRGSGASRRLRALRAFVREQPLAAIGIAVLALWLVVSALAPLLAPYDPIAQDLVERLQPPSSDHLFGTDSLGRDVFSRVLYGGRLSLPVGFVVVCAAALLGATVGAVAGFGPRVLDTTLMRLAEVTTSFPIILLALTIAAALGAGWVNALIALAIVSWPRYARLVRGLVLELKPREFVLAQRAIGAPEHDILRRTILPQCLGPLAVLATIDLGNAILVFAGLSFLGLGAPPPTPEWGSMVAEGAALYDDWWIAVFPGLAILTAVFAANLLGDGLRDALDPRLRSNR